MLEALVELDGQEGYHRLTVSRIYEGTLNFCGELKIRLILNLTGKSGNACRAFRVGPLDTLDTLDTLDHCFA